MTTNSMSKIKKRLEQPSKLQALIESSDGRQRKLSYSSSTSTPDTDACEIVEISHKRNRAIKSERIQFKHSVTKD